MEIASSGQHSKRAKKAPLHYGSDLVSLSALPGQRGGGGMGETQITASNICPSSAANTPLKEILEVSLVVPQDGKGNDSSSSSSPPSVASSKEE
jgi:hypothetical protein